MLQLTNQAIQHLHILHVENYYILQFYRIQIMIELVTIKKCFCDI